MPIYLEKSRRNPRRLKAKRRRARANPVIHFYGPGGVCLPVEIRPGEDIRAVIGQMRDGGFNPGPPPQAQAQYQAPPPQAQYTQYQQPQAQYTQSGQQPHQQFGQQSGHQSGQQQDQQSGQQQTGGFAAFQEAGEQYRRQKMKSDAEAEETKTKKPPLAYKDLYARIALALGGADVVCGDLNINRLEIAPIIKGTSRAEKDRGVAPIRDPRFRGRSGTGTYKIGETRFATALQRKGMIGDTREQTIAMVEDIAAALRNTRGPFGLLPNTKPQSESMSLRDRQEALKIITEVMARYGKSFTCPITPPAASNPRRRRRRYYL